MPDVSGKSDEAGSETTTYRGVLRQFGDGTWGALCFELGLITRGPTENDALRQMTELIEFELECIKSGDARTAATMELLADFMTCDVEEMGEGEYVSAPFPSRWFRLPENAKPKLVTA